jgi:hypothetical protein
LDNPYATLSLAHSKSFLWFFKVTPSFEGNVYQYVYAVEVLSYWTLYVFMATLARPHINTFLQFFIYTQKWRIIPGNDTFYTEKDVFPSFSQLCFTNLARLCHKKSLPQIRESPLLNQESQILPGEEEKGGWKCLTHVQATYLTLNFIILCDCHIRVATLMPSTLHFE